MLCKRRMKCLLGTLVEGKIHIMEKDVALLTRGKFNAIIAKGMGTMKEILR